MTDAAELLLAMAVELAELRQQLAEAQDHLFEVALDAGHLHTRVEDLQHALAETRAERDASRAESDAWRAESDAWRSEAERRRRAV